MGGTLHKRLFYPSKECAPQVLLIAIQLNTFVINIVRIDLKSVKYTEDFMCL